MRRLVALVLIFIFILVGCSNTAPDKEIFQEKQEGTQSENQSFGNSGTSALPATPSDTHVTPSDIPENTGPIPDATPSDIPDEPVYSSPLDAKLGEEYSSTQQVIIVSVDDETTTVCTIEVYGKENGQWVLVDSCKGYVGYKGCVNGAERMQSTNKTPLGILAPTLVNFPGSFKNSTISSKSSFSSFNPATLPRLILLSP